MVAFDVDWTYGAEHMWSRHQCAGSPAPVTGIDYLQLVTDAHHQQVIAEETDRLPRALQPRTRKLRTRKLRTRNCAPEQVVLTGQLSLDDIDIDIDSDDHVDDHGGGARSDQGREDVR